MTLAGSGAYSPMFCGCDCERKMYDWPVVYLRKETKLDTVEYHVYLSIHAHRGVAEIGTNIEFALKTSK